MRQADAISVRWLIGIFIATQASWLVLSLSLADVPLALHVGFTMLGITTLALVALGSRINTLAALSRREELLRLRATEHIAFQANILAQVSDAVIAVDADRRITYWNTAAEVLYGVKQADALGHEPEDLFRPALLGDTTASGSYRPTGIWRGEHVHYTRDGRSITVSVAPSTLYDSASRPIGWLAVIHDSTAQSQARQSLQEQARQQAVIARISRSALLNQDLPALLDDLVKRAARAFGLHHAAVFEAFAGSSPG
ncbi:MAG: PAS domain S-box protein [Oscillochloris sp.]|nr:PAS domain S-box protein [Oscillochloris sp.]